MKRRSIKFLLVLICIISTSLTWCETADSEAPAEEVWMLEGSNGIYLSPTYTMELLLKFDLYQTSYQPEETTLADQSKGVPLVWFFDELEAYVDDIETAKAKDEAYIEAQDARIINLEAQIRDANLVHGIIHGLAAAGLLTLGTILIYGYVTSG